MENTMSEELMRGQIKNESALYFLRSTPFTEHSELNYNGTLTESFFFKHLFSKKGKYETYVQPIKEALITRGRKTILLTGNQGCGKTTFVHCLKYECPDITFKFFDFDQDTSHPTLEEYIERLSSYLHVLLLNKDNATYNTFFYDLFIRNRKLINTKINAGNNINNFFNKFHDTFILNCPNGTTKDDFIIEINKLYFNQILSLIILWHLSKIIKDQKDITPIVFCLDNLDVLVNQDIIERFFKEYFRFVRNIDAIINHLDEDYIRSKKITYNSAFSFVLVCRQHTWARVKQHYPHDNPAIHLSTLQRNITDVFDKSEILEQREKYISDNNDFFGEFVNDVSSVCSILNDLDPTTERGHNIYDLFNNDYRQCIITFEDLINENDQLLNEYICVKKSLSTVNQGLRGIMYRALFEKFKLDGNLSDIGVLDVSNTRPLVSNARLILNYLNYKTYNKKGCVPFSRIVSDFDGIISRDDIDLSLIAMFKLGYMSSWNELIAFDEINTEEIETCENTELMITAAGHEYIDFVATHFEFFNIRVPYRRRCEAALFSPKSIAPYPNPKLSYKCNGKRFFYKYNFEEIIVSVLNVVEQCCEHMTEFFNTYMAKKYTKEQYLYSPFVYGDSNVLHGERIIHTHIRYVDNYRLYLLNRHDVTIFKEEINEILVRLIEEYIRIGECYPCVLTGRSSDHLFPAFKKIIQDIKDSGYTSPKAINVS